MFLLYHVQVHAVRIFSEVKRADEQNTVFSLDSLCKERINKNVSNFRVGTVKTGRAVAQFVESLRYKQFDSRWSHCNFSLT